MIYNKITEKFINIMNSHMNPIWALEELEYLVFKKHNKEFYGLTEKDQWEVRCCLLALNKVYR